MTGACHSTIRQTVTPAAGRCSMIIVDDFYYDLQEATSIVDWEQLGIHVIATVHSASEALKILERQNCDIILTDVAMPGINGIELARRVKSRSPAVEVVFMSCHADFEYARAALRLGAVAYVTKPLIREEVEQTFTHLRHELSDRPADGTDTQLRIAGESVAALREHLARELLFGTHLDERTARDRANKIGMRLGDGPFRLVVWELLTDNTADPGGFEGKVRTVSQYSATASTPIIITQTDEGRLVAWYGDQTGADADNLRLLVKATLESLAPANAVQSNQSVLGAAPATPALRAIISRRFAAPNECSTNYHECLVAGRSIKRPGVVDLDRYGAEDRAAKSMEFTALQQILRVALFSTEETAFQEAIHDLGGYLRNIKTRTRIRAFLVDAVVGTILITAEHDVNVRSILDHSDYSWESLEHVRTRRSCLMWLCGLLRAVRAAVQHPTHDRDACLVEMIKDHVWDHLGDVLTLDALAGHFLFSANYLNAIFKGRTGETIPAFVVRARIAHAKTILAKPEMRLYEVATAVGYRHLPNFNAVFRRYTGMTLNEYRRRGTDV